jgi:hypothetical protein
MLTPTAGVKQYIRPLKEDSLHTRQYRYIFLAKNGKLPRLDLKNGGLCQEHASDEELFSDDAVFAADLLQPLQCPSISL